MKTDKKIEKGYKVANIGGEKYIHEDTVNEIVIRAVEDGVRGFAEAIRFDFSQMGLVVRPKWTDPRAYIQCTCGQILQTVGESRQHWQDGHFDETTSEFADKIINKNIETYLQSLDKGEKQ